MGGPLDGAHAGRSARPPLRTLSLRWWFENRTTGVITIGQFPNWPLFAIAVLWIVDLAVADGTSGATVLGALTRLLWLGWGADELIRGVNPWRRLLGTAVIAWQLFGLLG